MLILWKVTASIFTIIIDLRYIAVMWFYEVEEDERDIEKEEELFSIIPKVEENDDFKTLSKLYEDLDDETADLDF